MNSNNSAALDLLRLVEQDVTTLRSARQASFRRRKQDYIAPPDRLEEARQAGLEEGLLLALQTITKRLQLESATRHPEMSVSLIDARLKLQSAEVAYALADHGASAPLSSASYSAYVQAYKVL